MKYLTKIAEIFSVDEKVKNKWRIEWLDEKDATDHFYREWCRKIDKAGAAFCILCNTQVLYGSSGKKSLKKHSDDPNHKKFLNAQALVQSLPGAKPELAPISLIDRTTRLKAITSSFLSEHCLPFSLAPNLVNFAKKLAEDERALSNLSLSRTAATYITTYGIARTFQSELCLDLSSSFFSLNIDESTNNKMDKILNILVRYYNEDQKKVVTDHLASRKQNISTALNIYGTIKHVFDDLNIPLTNTISCLMDNCNTMRGIKGGVETIFRKDNPFLLNVSGDTVHMFNNAAKAFSKAFKNYVEDFCSDTYYDIEKSPKARELFSEIQALLNYRTVSSVIRPIPSRFLQLIDVTDRINELIPALNVYYFSYLTNQEKNTHQKCLNSIFNNCNINAEAITKITVVQNILLKQYKSDCNKARKDRILVKLFNHSLQLSMYINILRGILPMFQRYVKLLQTDKPVLHKIHAEMVHATKVILALFIKPSNLPETSVKKLVTLDVKNRAIQFKDNQLSVGPYCYDVLQNAKKNGANEHWIKEYYLNLRKGYEDAGSSLLKNVPLSNKVLQYLAALNPELRKEASISESLLFLAKSLSNVVKSEELGTLQIEIRLYAIDTDCDHLYKLYEQNVHANIDTDWWNACFNLKCADDLSKPKYPILTKLVKALLSVFTGPLVEGTFNIMDDIIRQDRTSLTVENYEGTVIVKSGLKRRNIIALDLKADAKMIKNCHYAYKAYNDHKTCNKELKQGAIVDISANKKKRELEVLFGTHSSSQNTKPSTSNINHSKKRKLEVSVNTISSSQQKNANLYVKSNPATSNIVVNSEKRQLEVPINTISTSQQKGATSIMVKSIPSTSYIVEQSKKPKVQASLKAWFSQPVNQISEEIQ